MRCSAMRRLLTVSGVMVFALLAGVSAHSFLTVPMPISRVETCRIGGNPGFEANCHGPCPNFNYRYDMRPDNPAQTWVRGSQVTIHYSRNNHEGGFMRLTMVPFDEMMRKDVHEIMAFYYGCWSADRYSCNDFEKHRDCGYDLDNEAFKTTITVPTIYPDGVYVLGWTWYGGGEGFGSFGDYYDCSFVRIKGGPLTDMHTAVFKPGPRFADGCQAAVNKLGVCNTEPCGEEFWSSKTVPDELLDANDNRINPVVYRAWYEQALQRGANRIQVSEPADFGVVAFNVIDTGNEQRMNVNQNAFIDLTGIQGITILPVLKGHVQRIEWVVNGQLEADRYQWPYSIGGEQHEHGRVNYFDWPYPVTDQRVFVTAIAHSQGRMAYYSQELFFRKN